MKNLLKAFVLLLACTSCQRPPVNEDYQTAHQTYGMLNKKLAREGIFLDKNYRSAYSPQPYLSAQYTTKNFTFRHVRDARKFYMKIYNDYLQALVKDPTVKNYVKEKTINGDILNIGITFYQRYDDRFGLESERTTHPEFPSIAKVDIENETIRFFGFDTIEKKYKIVHTESLKDALLKYSNIKNR